MKKINYLGSSKVIKRLCEIINDIVDAFPSKTSDLTNDGADGINAFIDATVNNLVNYYKKTETYTQAEVNALIANLRTFEVVASLPVSDISTSTIYLVPKTTPGTDNVYDEYINTDGTSAGWELIGDTQIDLSNYVTTTDLQTALADYVLASSLATVATSGSYNDLSNKPTIPAAQVNSDWNASSGVAQILNKPSLATVATSGSYNDLSDKPTIPTVNNATLTIQKNGTTVKTFTANAATNVTANITVPTKVSELTNDSGYITGYTDTWRKVQLNGVDKLGTGTNTNPLNLKAGSNVSINESSGTFTFAATDTTYSAATQSAAGLMSAADKTKLDGVATGAEVNQNAFSNVKVGATTVAADSKTDTLELVAGSNITLTPDATNDKVTIAATDTNTTYTFATGDAAGQIKVTPSGGSAQNVDVNGVVKTSASAAQKVSLSSGSAGTVLQLQGKASATWLQFLNSSGASLGYIGVESNKKPAFYDSASHELALLDDVIKKTDSAAQTIEITAADYSYPLAIKSTHSILSLIKYVNSNGTELGRIGVNSSNKPVFYYNSVYELALKSDLPSLPLSIANGGTGATSVMAAKAALGIPFFGWCNTASTDDAKEVTCTGFTSDMLVSGAMINVRFLNASGNGTNRTLNVQNTGAKSTVTRNNVKLWGAGDIMTFVYDGTNWVQANQWYY